MSKNEMNPNWNSPRPFPIKCPGKEYVSLSQLCASEKEKSDTDLNTASGKLHNHRKHDEISSDLLDEYLLQALATHIQRPRPQRTTIYTDNGPKDCKDLYKAQKHTVKYVLFRSRLVRLQKRDMSIGDREIEHAATFKNSEWLISYGGGRRKPFIYTGDLHPEARGKYSGFTAFLKSIGRYEDREALQDRRQHHWDIDDLLREPILRDPGPGYIYLITNIETEKSYVGLSVNKPEVRFHQHLNAARNNKGSTLHDAIREYGEDAFILKTLEVVHDGKETLPDRERYWIKKLNTLAPNGYNNTEGGEVGGAKGKKVTYSGRTFPSIDRMCRTLSEETGLPGYVIERCWKQNRPLPLESRKRSKHPEAGTPLYRQWLGIKKRAQNAGDEVASQWEDYDTWKTDTQKLKGRGRLTRIDPGKPWGPENVTRMTMDKIVERTHGTPFTACGRTWPTKQAAFNAHGIASSVYYLRIKSGMSVEAALTTPLGPTSKKEFEFEGEMFPSKNVAANQLAERYGLTFNQVKDRLRRSIPSSQWPTNVGNLQMPLPLDHSEI